MKKLMVLLGILVLMGSALAIVHIPQTHTDMVVLNSGMGVETFSDRFSPLRTSIGGYLCSDQPEDYGMCYQNGVGCEITCPATNAGGCAVVVFDSNYDDLESVDLNPGQTMELEILGIDPYYYWENYYCDSDCSCSAWSVSNCGINGCSANERYESRTCSVGCDLMTEACVSDIAFCGSECYDSDGIDYTTRGYVESNNVVHYDTCASEVKLNEWVCSSATTNGDFSIINTHYCASNEECKDGKCAVKNGGGGNASCDTTCTKYYPIKELGTYVDPMCYATCSFNEFMKGVLEITITVIKLVASVIVALASMMASKSMLYNKKKGKNNNNLQATILAIILGLIIGFGVWIIL